MPGALPTGRMYTRVYPEIPEFTMGANEMSEICPPPAARERGFRDVNAFTDIWSDRWTFR